MMAKKLTKKTERPKLQSDEIFCPRCGRKVKYTLLDTPAASGWKLPEHTITNEPNARICEISGHIIPPDRPDRMKY